MEIQDQGNIDKHGQRVDDGRDGNQLAGLGKAGEDNNNTKNYLAPEDEKVIAGDIGGFGASGKQQIFGNDTGSRVQDSQLGGGEHQAGDNEKDGGEERKGILADKLRFV